MKKIVFFLTLCLSSFAQLLSMESTASHVAIDQPSKAITLLKQFACAQNASQAAELGREAATFCTSQPFLEEFVSNPDLYKSVQAAIDTKASETLAHYLPIYEALGLIRKTKDEDLKFPSACMAANIQMKPITPPTYIQKNKTFDHDLAYSDNQQESSELVFCDDKGLILQTIPFSDKPISSMVYSPTGEHLAVATPDGLFIVTTSGKCKKIYHVLKTNGQTPNFAWDHDGNVVAAAYCSDQQQLIVIHDLRTGVQQALTLDDTILQLEFSRNANLLIRCPDHIKIASRNLPEKTAYVAPHNGKNIIYDLRNYTLAVAGSAKDIFLYNFLYQNMPPRILTGIENVALLVTSPTGRFIAPLALLAATSHDHNNILVWDCHTGELLHTFYHTSKIVHAQIIKGYNRSFYTPSKNYYLLLTKDCNNIIHLWDCKNGSCVFMYKDSASYNLTFLENKASIKRILSYGPGGIHAWDIESSRNFEREISFSEALLLYYLEQKKQAKQTILLKRDNKNHITQLLTDSWRNVNYFTYFRFSDTVKWEPCIADF